MNCPNCNSEDVGRVPASGIAEGAMQCQDCKWDSENAAPRPESFMSLQPWSRRNLGDEKFDEARESETFAAIEEERKVKAEFARTIRSMTSKGREEDVLKAWKE